MSELLELNRRNGHKLQVVIELRADTSMNGAAQAQAMCEFRKLTNSIDYQLF